MKDKIIQISWKKLSSLLSEKKEEFLYWVKWDLGLKNAFDYWIFLFLSGCFALSVLLSTVAIYDCVKRSNFVQHCNQKGCRVSTLDSCNDLDCKDFQMLRLGERK